MDEERLENEELNREQEEAGFPSPEEEDRSALQSPVLAKGQGFMARLKGYFKAGTASTSGDGLLPTRENEPAEEQASSEDQSTELNEEQLEAGSSSSSEAVPEMPGITEQDAEPAQDPGQSTAESEQDLEPKASASSMIAQIKKDVKEFAARFLARRKTPGGLEEQPSDNQVDENAPVAEAAGEPAVAGEAYTGETSQPEKEIQPEQVNQPEQTIEEQPEDNTAAPEPDGGSEDYSSGKENILTRFSEGAAAAWAAATEWVKRIFHKEPDLPIDEALALKLSQKKDLDEEIRTRRRETAHTLKKLNRSKKERKELLQYQAKLRGELAHILATMKDRTRDVSGLEKQSLALQREIEESSGRHGQLLDQIQSAKSQLESVTSVIGQHKAQSEILDGELAAKQTALSSLIAELEQAKAGLDTARAEAASLHREKEATEQAWNGLKEQLAGMEQDRIEKNSQLAALLMQLESKQKEADEKLHQSMVLEGVLEGLRQDLRSSQDALQSDKDQAGALESSIKDGRARQDTLNSSLEQLQNQVSQQQQSLYLLKNETEILSKTRAEIEGQIRRNQEELTGAESLLVERNRQVASLEKGIEELQQGTANRQNIQQMLQQKIEGLKSDGMAIAKKVDEMSRQKQSMEAGLEQAWKKLSEAEAKISQRENFRLEAEAKLQKLQAEIKSAFAQIEALKQDKLQLEGSRDISVRQLEEINRSLSEAQQNQVKAAGELERTRESLIQSQEEYDKLGEERSALQNEISQKKADHTALESRYQALQASVNESLSRLGQTGEEQKKISAQVAALEDERQRLKDEIKLLNQSGRELNQAREMLQSKKRETEQWIQEALPFQKQQQSQIEQQVIRLKELQQQAAEALRQAEEGRRELEEINQQNQELMQERARGAMTAESELASLHQQAGDMKREVNALAEQITEHQAQNRQREEEVSQTRAELELLKNSRDQAQAGLQEIQQAMEQARQDLEQKKKNQNEALMQMAREIEQKQKDQSDELLQLTREVETAKNQARQEIEQRQKDQSDELLQLAQETETAKKQVKQQLVSIQGQLDDKYRQLDDVTEMVRQNEEELSAKQRQRDELDQQLISLKNQQKEISSYKENWDNKKAALERELEEKQKSVSQKSEEESGILKRLKMLSAEAAEYQARSKELNELTRKIEDQKRVLEDIELQAEKKSGLFT
jgi:chromosome segregation protein